MVGGDRLCRAGFRGCGVRLGAAFLPCEGCDWGCILVSRFWINLDKLLTKTELLRSNPIFDSGVHGAPDLCMLSMSLVVNMLRIAECFACITQALGNHTSTYIHGATVFVVGSFLAAPAQGWMLSSSLQNMDAIRASETP